MAIEAKDINQQIGILKSRGMKFIDIRKASECLERKNYYNVINAFKDLFLESTDPEKYYDDTSFEEVFSIYQFDVELRNIFLKYILLVENEIKSILTSKVALQYNSCPYFSDAIYDLSTPNKQKDVTKFENTVVDIYSKNKTNSSIKHFLDRGDLVPLWAFLNVFDFGQLRIFYSLLNSTLKNEIAKFYKLSTSDMVSMLSVLNMYRNVCAHSNRIYNYKIVNYDKQLSDLGIHASLLINKTSDGRYIYGKRDLFSVVISMKYLLCDDDFKEFYDELCTNVSKLQSKLVVIKIEDVLKEMGFPMSDSTTGQKDWRDINTASK